ncbi:MAG: tRNA (adenosine(37)-N6)-dimethylallyltransferase MiaA [Cryomorphaceae bacterium]|jgi:tRNA dimethylallyltransferase|nr:tRNA (adenosine(37)-N6)-dimethylallyltransferase MiaA [Cryomorphaceae bacterium]
MNHGGALWMIHGPTASGKTGLAISLAKHLGTEIVNCDARQVYRELRIGVARPTDAELAAVPHHGIASHSIHEPLTAASYAAWAEPVVRDVLARTGSAVVVGGSGLYAKALLHGLDPMPAADADYRAELEAVWKRDPQALVDRLVQLDPEYAAAADLQNARRVIRALEVIHRTGETYSAQRRGAAQRSWPVPVREIALDAPQDWLDARIAARCAAMMAEGLQAEALGLAEYADLSPLRTVGYQEFYAPDAPVDRDGEMTALLALRTRQYAKRQRTWLAKMDVRVPAPDAWNYLRSHVGA